MIDQKCMLTISFASCSLRKERVAQHRVSFFFFQTLISKDRARQDLSAMFAPDQYSWKRTSPSLCAENTIIIITAVMKQMISQLACRSMRATCAPGRAVMVLSALPALCPGNILDSHSSSLHQAGKGASLPQQRHKPSTFFHCVHSRKG